MSLTAFDTLRREYPAEQPLLALIEDRIVDTIRQDPRAVIDDWALTDQLRIDHETVAKVVLRLVHLRALEMVFYWSCPNGMGTVREAPHPRDFPSFLECDRCGRTHEYSEEFIAVFYLPSQRMRVEAVEMKSDYNDA